MYSCLTQGDYDLFLAEAPFGAAIQVLDQIIAQVDALPNGHRALQGFLAFGDRRFCVFNSIILHSSQGFYHFHSSQPTLKCSNNTASRCKLISVYFLFLIFG